MELIETHTGVQTEVEDAADIVFPSGKSKLKASSPSPSRKKRSRNVAKGDYGVTMVCPSKAGSPPESHRTPLQTGLSKLVDASVRFHPDKDRVLKQGFAGQALTPPELREMLRRLFRIKLTEPELSALFAYFAPDGGMELDGSMFIILFIKMGQTERDRQRAEHREAERLYMNQRARESAGGQRRSTIHEGSPDDKAAGVKWGPEDRESAMALITEAAVTYDKYSPAAVSVDAFDGATMSPTMFREQLRRVFNVKLSPSQSAALIAAFDCDKGGAVDCSEFLTKLLITRFKERSRRLDAQREAERRRKEKKAKEADARTAESEAKARVQVDCTYSRADRARGLAKVIEAAMNYDPTGPSAVGLGAFQAQEVALQETLGVAHDFSEEDKASAMAKIADAASRYDKNHPSCLGLGAFQGAHMHPRVFKEQLKRVFGIKLNLNEFWAMVKEFDKDGSGNLSCADFLLTFFRSGFEARYKAVRRRRDEESARLRKAAKEVDRRHAEIERKRALAGVAPYAEKDLNHTLDLLIDAAARYERRQLGPAGMSAWEVKSMSPSELKETLKHTLELKVTPPQLGALTHLFGTGGGAEDGESSEGAVFAPQVRIDVSKFLTTFFKMSAAVKGMSVGRDAALRIAEYRVALKKHLAQQEEVRRTLKAMRSNPPKRPHTVDSGLAR